MATPLASKRASRASIIPQIPNMPVHPSFRQSDYNPPGLFRTFGNPLPLGFTAHGLACLVYGSYCANWRQVGTPLLVSALCLGISAPGAFVASILCFISNETFFSVTFLAISGLWAFLGLAYLPVTGILDFYLASPETATALSDSIAIVLVWYGIVAITLGLIVSRRNFVFPAILVLDGISLFVTAAAYFKHQVSTSTLSKAGGYLLVISGVLAAVYVVAACAAAERFPLQIPLGHGFDPQRLPLDEQAQFASTHLGQRNLLFHTGLPKQEKQSQSNEEATE